MTKPDSQAPQPAPSWTVNVAGPDDVHRFDTELDALRFANQVNRTYLADLLAHPGDEVLCLATVSDASPALPTQPLRDTGVETPLLHTDRLNLVGRWFEGRGMTTMAHICREAAKDLKAIADRRDEAVAEIVSSGPADMPLLRWLSADLSFRAPIGSRLYAVPPSQPKCLEDLMTKIQAFGLACYQHESGEEQIAMQDEIRRDLAACLAIPAPEGGELPDAMTYAGARSWAVTKEWCRGWDDARAALAAQPHGGAGVAADVWTHKFKGGTYRVLNHGAKLQTDFDLGDLEVLMVYQGEDGRVWCRPPLEFYSRFVQTPPSAEPAKPAAPPAPAEGDAEQAMDAWIERERICWGDYDDEVRDRSTWLKVWKAATAAKAQGMPAGFALVPLEPTPEMRKAAVDAWLDSDSRLFLNKAAAALRAGIAAAPTPVEGS